MAGKPGTTKMNYPSMRAAVDAFLQAGSITGAAKTLGLSRRAIQHRLEAARKEGLIGKERSLPNASRWRPADEIIARRKGEFRRVSQAGPGSGHNILHLPDDGPFGLIAFGDLHLDNPGTDLSLFEYWANHLNRDKHVHGALLGDVLDNWVKPLAFLYAQAETTAPEGWILFEHYLDQMAPDLDLSVGGNHDAWSGSNDLLGRMMEERGILHRGTSLRATYRTKGGRELTMNLRHSWPGRSMWNEVHGMKRAARMGVRDTVLLGGHTHISGESIEKCPLTKRLTWCVQVASFKSIDDYADDLGLSDRSNSPAVFLVIDPRRSDLDPELVKVFHDPEAGRAYLDFLRSQM
jgi:hypothetical protein